MSKKSITSAAVAFSFAFTFIGPVGAASAEPQEPDAIAALDAVPGLAQAAVHSSDAEMTRSGVGVAVEGASGAETIMTKLDAESTKATYDSGGQAVIESTSLDTDTVVQKLPDGARIVEVIGSSDAPEDFAYQFDVPDGMTLLPQDDGSILVGVATTTGDSVQVEVDSVIGAPWATDANGQAVAATYEIGNDGTVTMHVEHSDGVAYPVVADPTITVGGFRAVYSLWTPWIVTVFLNKARTADAQDVGSGICIGIAFVPVYGPVIAALCALNNTALRWTSRYGYCQYWNVNAITRTFSVNLYKGGFCS